MRLENARYLGLGIAMIAAFFAYTIISFYALRYFNVPYGSFENFLIGGSGFVFIVLSVNCFLKAFRKPANGTD